VTAFIVTTVAFFATNAIMSEPFSSVGFWQPGPLVNTGLFDDIDGLSCPTGGACAVVAVTVPTEDWSIGSISNDRIVASEALRSSNPANITCATQLVCLAMDRNVPVRSTDRGRTFDGMKIASEPGMSFRCDSPKRCYAFAPALMSVSTDEGLHWKTLLALPTSENGTTIYSGACPTVSDCTVVGRKVGGPIASYTLTGGRSWLPASGVAGFDQLSSVRCVTDLTCYALATNASGLLSVVTTNAGKHWSSLSKIPQIESMSGFACPEALTCVASGGTLGSDSVVEVTTSGGKAWRTSLAVSSNAQLGPLGCNHQGMCAVGLSYIFSRQRPGIETSTNYGQSWTVVPFPRVPVTK
jgi:hypothetical protein